jgi:hypothetical protein
MVLLFRFSQLLLKILPKKTRLHQYKFRHYDDPLFLDIGLKPNYNPCFHIFYQSQQVTASISVLYILNRLKLRRPPYFYFDIKNSNLLWQIPLMLFVSNQHRIVIYQKIFKASLASIAYWPISVP